MCGAPRAANPARSPPLTAQLGGCSHVRALFPLAQPRPDPSGPHGDRRGFGEERAPPWSLPAGVCGERGRPSAEPGGGDRIARLLQQRQIHLFVPLRSRRSLLI